MSAMTEFTGRSTELGGFRIATDPAGLLLGTDRAGAPVMLRLFRPTPTRIVLVDRGWVERILIFRALGLGARVVIQTPAPQQWDGFSTQATGDPQRLLALPPGHPTAATASVHQPMLVVTEGPPAQSAPIGPWQTQVTVAPWLGEHLAQAVFEADLVVLRRLSEQELAVAASMLRIDEWDTQALRTTPDDGVVLYRPDQRQYVRVVPTALERQAFGTPRVQ